MQRLSGLDSGFFYLDTPGMNLHIGVILLLEAPQVSRLDLLATIREHMQDRLPWMHHFQDLIVEVPFGLAEPYWARNAQFNIADHVTQIDDNRELTKEDLIAFLGEFISIPLDKSRSLWEVKVVPCVEGNRIAFIAKLHHALIDGVQGVEVLVSLLDFEPNPTEFWGESTPCFSNENSDANLVLEVGRSIFKKIQSAPKDLVMALNLVEQWFSFRSEADNANLIKPAFGAPKTPINGALSPTRVAHALNIPLQRVTDLAKGAGVTVNDVVMVMVSLALDGYLSDKGWSGGKDLTAMMPIAKSKRDSNGGSNQISSMFVSLANSIADPIERLSAISRATKAAKNFHINAGLNEAIRLAEYVPPIITRNVSRLMHEARVFDILPPLYNVLISTLNGTPMPLYFDGLQLLEIIPFGPLADSSGLNVTSLSYNGQFSVGFVGESHLAGDLDKFAQNFVEALDKLTVVLLDHGVGIS